ncbi:MAG: UDP-N-acetylmuramate--L-alanine ligase [Bacteriovoracaceae bacterium]|nr:UDP-N-acetylmuramate--L-alanine ligase [Bacteriovoracaceae bacterium]
MIHNKKIHFIGIGGIGMSAIAKVLIKMGNTISGSDRVLNANTDELKALGANIFENHCESHLGDDVDYLVYNSAIRDNNPEFIKAKKLNIEILKRAQMLSRIIPQNKGIAVAGSHGKTTTACYLSELLYKLDESPSFIVGGIVKEVKTNGHKGSSEHFVIEADESDASFLFFNTLYSIVTNIDNDHLDNYGGREKLEQTFIKYINENSIITILNMDDPGIQKINDDINKKNIIRYSSHKDKYDVFFEIKSMYEGVSDFSLSYKNNKYNFVTNVLGEHNINNLISAVIYLLENGICEKKIQTVIKNITGIRRRFDKLVETKDFLVIDDYAHHPTEIKCVIDSIKKSYPNKKLIAFFEPHRFTRTKNFWDEFSYCFEGTDNFYLLPIYDASEDPIEGITSKRLFEDITNTNKEYLASLSAIKENLTKYEKNGNIILSLGAGPISKEFRTIYNASAI